MAPSYEGERIRKSLLKKGFEELPGDHHHLVFVIDGRRTRVRTKVSRGKTEYARGLFTAVCKQLCLSKAETIDLIECPMDGVRYRGVLQKLGRL